MTTKQLKFQFKGQRNYIQGPDLFNAMTGAYADGNNLGAIRFSAHGFVHKPLCLLHSVDCKEALSSVADVRARCQFTKNGEQHWLALTECEDDSAAIERQDYDEQKLIELCKVEGDSIRLNAKTPYTFIETIVSMNKHLHQQLFPEASGKWIFTQIELETQCDEREQLALKFMHNMNFRLTKSDILVNGKKIGNLYFSLVKS